MKQYADEWNNSAEYFRNNNSYLWMCDQITKYKTIFEVGCGTGQSTLSLLESGHKIIVAEKNTYCLNMAKNLIKKFEYTICPNLEAFYKSENCVYFIECYIVSDEVLEMYFDIQFDLAICWNIGTYWSKAMMLDYFPKMIEYGLNELQIKQNPESSYAELLLWFTCKFAAIRSASVHIIERGAYATDESNDVYYYTLKDEFGFSKITYNNKEATALSEGGRKLSTNGIVHKTKDVDITFVSILLEA